MKVIKVLMIILAVTITLGGVLVLKTIINSSKYKEDISKQLKCYDSDSTLASIDKDKAILDLSRALKYKTIYSYDKSKVDENEFKGMHELLDSAFPNIKKKIDNKEIIKENINKYGLLYKWPGEDDSEAIVLMAHMDVVGGDNESNEEWHKLIFSGKVKDDYIYGRGALDIKGQLMSIMESVDLLIKEGYVPKKTVYIAIGHDEEQGGEEGNKEIVKILKNEGKKIDSVYDEGGFIVKGVVPNVDSPVALIGIAEKGCLTLKISAKKDGGHSSTPNSDSAILAVSSAVSKLKDSPLKKEINKVSDEFLKTVAPKMPFIYKLGIYNNKLFGPIIKDMFSKIPSMNAMITTTIAPTIITGGDTSNVIPDSCEAVVNFRILPGETVESVKDEITKYLKDEDVDIEIIETNWDPSKISSVDSESYKNLKRTVNINFKDTIAAPFLVVGCTDSRYYGEICDNVYKFSPVTIESEDIKRVHGEYERISKDGYIRMIDFYYDLIKNLQ